MANVTPTVLTSGMAGATGNSFNTASIAPTANRLITVAVYNRKSTANPNTPTITGASMTWTQVVTQQHRDDNAKFTIFRALSASPGSGVLTIDFASETQQMCHWSITSWENIDIGGTNGANACPQGIGVDNANSTSSMTGTLGSAITSSESATYGGMGLVDAITDISPGDSETELVDQNNNVTFDWKTAFQWKQGTDNAMAWSYTSGGNNPVGAFVEVKTSPSSAFLAFL